ncbi:MAG TPA: cupin domain-containing protein [Rariglobus sp.]|jgi:predicted cupin superfamily sugar epimerase|nr:cupin domain-containing protein [Rariglobus sp.]
MTAAEIIASLQLEPLPNEGGFFRQTYVSAARLPGGRPLGTAIYFLITPDGFSALHRLHTGEIWHFYAGDAVEHLTLDPATGEGRKIRLGGTLASGQIPQLVVAGGIWQGARLVAGGSWALLGCTMSPGWDAAEFVLGDRGALATGFPEWAQDIRALTR